MKLAQKLGIGLFAAVLTIAGAAEAAPVTINFDDLVIGAYPAHVDVTNQYAAQGVIFSGSGYPEALFFGSGLIVAQYPYIRAVRYFIESGDSRLV